MDKFEKGNDHPSSHFTGFSGLERSNGGMGGVNSRPAPAEFMDGKAGHCSYATHHKNHNIANSLINSSHKYE